MNMAQLITKAQAAKKAADTAAATTDATLQNQFIAANKAAFDALVATLPADIQEHTDLRGRDFAAGQNAVIRIAIGLSANKADLFAVKASDGTWVYVVPAPDADGVPAFDVISDGERRYTDYLLAVADAAAVAAAM